MSTLNYHELHLYELWYLPLLLLCIHIAPSKFYLFVDFLYMYLKATLNCCFMITLNTWIFNFFHELTLSHLIFLWSDSFSFVNCWLHLLKTLLVIDISSKRLMDAIITLWLSIWLSSQDNVISQKFFPLWSSCLNFVTFLHFC